MQKTEFTPETATQRSTKHDDFVRGACMQTFIVEPLLRHFVEPELSDKFDYKTLKLCQDSYITPELANYYTDRLWSVDFKNSQAVLQLLLLVEHKSFVPKRIHIQVLRYMIEEWTKQINAQLEALQELTKNGKKSRQKIKLILILPIVLYHGKSVWTLPKFEDLFGHLPDILKRFLPDFDIIVIDLAKYSDQEIIDTKAGLLVNMLLLLRHSFDRDYLVKNVDLLLSGLEDYDADSEYWHFVHMLFVYFLTRLKNNSMEKAAVVEKIQAKQKKKGFYSMYDAIVDESMDKGAMKKARLLVLRGKWKGASADFLADQSELSLSKVKNMLKGYDVVYQLWANKKPAVAVDHLTEEEVNYLMNLFGEK
jgi:hypothetical protein